MKKKFEINFLDTMYESEQTSFLTTVNLYINYNYKWFDILRVGNLKNPSMTDANFPLP